MKTEHLSYILEINRLRSISAAARALHMGQTRLSAMVKALEDELGYAIFTRTPKGVAPTLMGEMFISLAWEVNVKFESLQRLKERSAGDAPTVILLISPSAALRLAIPLTQKFHRYGLQTNLLLQEHTTQGILENLEKQVANIGITYITEDVYRHWESEKDTSPLQVEILQDTEFVLLVGKDHPMANRDVVDVQELHNERLARPRNFHLKENLEKLVMPRSQNITGFASTDMMCQAIYEDGFVGILPDFLNGDDSLVDSARFSFVKLCNTAQKNAMHLCLITNKNRAMLYQEEILCQCIREYFKEHSRSGAAGAV